MLDAIEAQKKRVTYFALDLDKPELVRTLSELHGRYTHVGLAGLWGTYDDGCIWLKQFNDCPRVILWLGSSVGNMTRSNGSISESPATRSLPYPTEEAGQFIRSFGEVLSPQDRFIIAIDTRSHNPEVVRTAYNDRAGSNRRFAMNALGSINDLFNAKVIDVSCFAYSPYYNEVNICVPFSVRSSVDDGPRRFRAETRRISVASSRRRSASHRRSPFLSMKGNIFGLPIPTSTTV